MKKDWLWDRKISVSEARKILKDPRHKKFTLLASLLLARKNEPREVFKEYIDPFIFCKYWTVIKKGMRHNRWNEPRIIFWQAVYEQLLNKYRRQGISFRRGTPKVRADICKIIGKRIRDVRKNQGLSQKELAKKMSISQQLISRVEKGKENISLITLKNISDTLGKKVEIHLT